MKLLLLDKLKFL